VDPGADRWHGDGPPFGIATAIIQQRSERILSSLPSGLPRQQHRAAMRASFLKILTCTLAVLLGSGSLQHPPGSRSSPDLLRDYCSGQDPDKTNCAYGARALAPQESNAVNGYAVQVATAYTQRGAVGHSGNVAWSRLIYCPDKCLYAYWLDYGVPGGPLWDAARQPATSP
jgi:hypothetical protein